MANDVFSIKDNLKIEFEIATAGNWIWGISTWDGGDTWGGSSSSIAWTDLHCEVVQIVLEHGVDIEQGVFVQPGGQLAEITMTSVEYDPFSSAVIHAGVPVRIQAEILPDTDPGLYVSIFEGIVESYTTSYDAFGNNLIKIRAIDGMQAFLNTQITSYTPASPVATADDIIGELVSTYWTGSAGYTPGTGFDLYYLDPVTWTDTTVGTIIDDCLKANQGAFFNTLDNYQTYLTAQDLKFIIEDAPLWDFSTTHDTSPLHICMTDLVISADSKRLPSEIQVTLSTGAVMTQRNQDAYELYGPITLQSSVRLGNTLAGQAWLDNLKLGSRLRYVEELTFDAIERSGQLRTFLWSDRLFSVGQVTYDLNGSNVTDPYFITKTSQFITPNAWSVTVELWRGV